MTIQIDGARNKTQLPRELHTSHLTAILLLVVMVFSDFDNLRPSGRVNWLMGWMFMLSYTYVIFFLGRNVSLQGGHYAWVTRLAGRQWGRLAGLCIWLSWTLFVMPVFESRFVFFQYVNADWLLTPNATFKFIMAMLVVSALIALLPLRYLKYAFLVAAGAYLAIFVLAGVVGLWSYLTGHMASLSAANWQHIPAYRQGKSFGGVLWPLLGIEAPFLLMGEVQGDTSSQRWACRYVWWGILCLGGAYMLAEIGTLLVVPAALNGEGSLLLVFLLGLGNWAGLMVLIVLVGIQMFTVAAILIVSSRLLSTLAWDKLLPAQLAHLNRYGVPVTSVLVQVIGVALLLMLSFAFLPDMLNESLANFQRYSISVIVEAIATILWLLATIQLLGLMLYRCGWDKRYLHNEGEAPLQRKRLWPLLGFGGAGLLLAVYGLISTLNISWLPALLPMPRWTYYVGFSTCLLLIICWLCAEVPYQGCRLMDVKMHLSSEKRLRARLEHSYREQEALAQSQQRLLREQDHLFQEQKRLALTDAITGLPNHRELITQLEHTLAHCRAYKEVCAVFFVDLDHFKSVNDTLGHQFGDALLREVGARLAGAMETKGDVGRYGGEEFVAFQSGIDIKQARMLAEHLRQCIIEQPFVLCIGEDTRIVRISVSIGVSMYPLHGMRRQELIAFADKAMYQAKSQGRNRICVVAPSNALPSIDAIGKSVSADAEVMTLQALLAILEARDRETYLHGLRLVGIVDAIARYLRCGPEDMYALRLAAMLHDLGKVSIPDTILNKEGPLDSVEWELMRQHPRIGQEILVKAGGIFSVVAVVTGAHHERWDGRGYPMGLEREEIPLLARILLVADTYDTLVTSRYQQPLCPSAACAELKRHMGTKFDPLVVRAFLAIFPQIQQESILPEHADAFGGSRQRDER